MFDDLDKEIEKLMSERKTKASKGTIISAPGTERIVLSTNTVDFMTCTANSDPNKMRYCIVHKDITRPVGPFKDVNGRPVSVVTKVVFDTVTAMLFNLKKQLTDSKRDLERAILDKESYKMTIDTLRKNGVID